MSPLHRRLAVALLLGLLAPVLPGSPAVADQAAKPAEASQSERAPAESPKRLPADAVSRQSVDLPGRSLRFTATAGSIPLYEGEGGPLLAEIAVTSYTLDDQSPAERPVTFVFNGGPGAASAYMQLGAIGPWRIDLDPPYPSGPTALIPNAETWLDFTDLVFVDPVATGYSRAPGGREAEQKLFGIDSDISSLATVVRKWVEKNGRQVSPKAIVGESYGGFRGPRLVRALAGQGVGIGTLVMVSPVLDFGWRVQERHTPLRWASELPSMAAAARDRDGGFDPSSLLDAERYASGEYLVDFLRGAADAAAVDRMTDRVSGLTGVDRSVVRQLAGRLDAGTFLRESHRGSARVGSLYDATITGFDPEPNAPESHHREDPVLDAMDGPLSGASTELYRRLGWTVDRPYKLLNREVSGNWRWGSGRRPPEVVGDLRDALSLDPKLKVLVVHGASDLVTPYFENKLILAQLPAFGGGDRLDLKVYGGGHMFYTRDASRRAFREDGRRLIGPPVAPSAAAPQGGATLP
jgi:carboxypeptidase C (cathepsin A)